MPPAPVLSDYQAAAKAQYEPQLEADITTGKANTAAQVANLESGKGQINTDYTSAIQNLQNSVQSQTAQINQLYSSRLLGNFSGLQGNDMGMMFSKANQQQATIESTRANKLAEISTQETNAQNAEIANESALKSKYQGLEAGAASSAYNTAVKDYQTAQQRDFSNQLALERLNISAAKAARSAGAAANKPLTQEQTAAAIRSGLESVKGGDNHVAPQDLAKAYKDWTGAGFDPKSFWTYFQGYWNPNQGNYDKQFYGAM